MLKKIGAITAVDALTKLLGYLLLPVYLGLMPKIEFGEFGYLTSAIAYTSLILGLCLYVPFIRNYCAADNDIEKKKIVSTIFIGLVLWLLLVDITFVTLKPFLQGVFENFFEIKIFGSIKYYLFIGAINSAIVLLYCYALLMARKTTSEMAFYLLVKFLTFTGISIFFIYANPWGKDTVVNRLLGTVVAEFLITIAYVLFKFISYFSWLFDRNVFFANLRIAIPLIPAALISLFTAVIDRRLIAQYHGMADLANYNLALQALAPVQMLMSAVQVAWAPHLFSIKNNRDALQQSMRLIWISLFVMVVATLLITFSVYAAIQLKYISFEYDKVPLVILFASFGAIASALVQLNNNMFVQLEKTSFQFGISLFLLTLNWALNIYWVPSYSIYGAAASAAISNGFCLIAGLYLLKKLVKRQA